MVELTHNQLAALQAARLLAEAGVPVFCAHRDADGRTTSGRQTGFTLPKGWENTTANPRYVDAWQSGMALCAVMGHHLDLIDADPRNGADLDQLRGILPVIYAVAATPSGGWHAYIKSLGVSSRDGFLPGVDYKGGQPDGRGRGFAFLPPTARLSKTTGELVEYTWAQPPDADMLAFLPDDPGDPDLADLIRPSNESSEFDQPAGSKPSEPSPWDDITATLAVGRDDGVFKLAAALRGRGGWRADDALEYMRRVVWPFIDQQQSGHPFTWEEFVKCVHSAFERYPDGHPASVTNQSDISTSTLSSNYDSLYLRRSELATLPQPRPLIDGVIDEHTLFAVTGRDRSYKSFLVLDWLACLATGKKWLDHEAHQTKVLLVVGEGAYGLHARLHAWETAWQTPIPDQWFHVRRAPVNLFKREADCHDLFERIEAEQYSVVILDTLQRMTSGADTNHARDAGVIIGSMDFLRRANDRIAVGIVAHTGKSDLDTRGSSAFEDDLDAIWRVKRDDDHPDTVVVKFEKRKDGPEGLRYELRPDPIRGTDSIVLSLARGMPPPPPEHHLALLKILAKADETGESKTNLMERLQISTRKLYAAAEYLEDEGLAVRFKSGQRTLWKITVSGLSALEQIGESEFDQP